MRRYYSVFDYANQRLGLAPAKPLEQQPNGGHMGHKPDPAAEQRTADGPAKGGDGCVRALVHAWRMVCWLSVERFGLDSIRWLTPPPPFFCVFVHTAPHHSKRLRS